MRRKKCWEAWTICLSSTLKLARTGNGHLQCKVLLDLWLLINDNHVNSVWLASAPSLPSCQTNKPETIVSNPKCSQWQRQDVQRTRSLHWTLQGHTVQCEALSWEQHKQLLQPQTHPLPLLVSSYRFPSSSPMAELHFLHTPEESWGLYWSTSVLAFSEKG